MKKKTPGKPVKAQPSGNPGELGEREPHPAAHGAMAAIRHLPLNKLAMWQESLASTALSGNRLAEICSETLDRICAGKTVSDRYLLGLAWVMRKDLK